MNKEVVLIGTYENIMELQEDLREELEDNPILIKIVSEEAFQEIIGEYNIDDGPNYKKLYLEALDAVDFTRIRNVMEYLDWKWYTATGTQVPSIEEMKNTTHRLFESCLDDLNESPELDEQICATGGFEVIVGREGFVTIKFVLESGVAV